ncbi:hypothetical protein RFI_29423, partial [Reticulomyxa filosa]
EYGALYYSVFSLMCLAHWNHPMKIGQAMICCNIKSKDYLCNLSMKMEVDNKIYLTDNFRSVIAQFANFWNLMMKAQNVIEIDKHLRYYVYVELTLLWKYQLFCRRRNQSTFDDFALIHKCVHFYFYFLIRILFVLGNISKKKKK